MWQVQMQTNESVLHEQLKHHRAQNKVQSSLGLHNSCISGKLYENYAKHTL